MADENYYDQTKPSGPIQLKNGWTIEVDRRACIGAATCVSLALKSFALDKEAKAIILKTADAEEETTIIAAAKSCPVDAVIIRDKDGKVIWPKEMNNQHPVKKT